MRRMKFYPITDIYVDFLHTYDTRVSENCKEEQFPIKKSTEQIECPLVLYMFSIIICSKTIFYLPFISP